MGRIPDDLIARERALLIDALKSTVVAKPRKRTLKLVKLSQRVERTWVSAGCFGEAIQWRLKGKP